jgi:aspartate carbamoyltransferase catalytic subunit
MPLKSKHLLSTEDLSKEEIEEIIEIAELYHSFALKEKTSDELKGKILASLFYEPSTRTRLSFETAMHRLSGDVITVTETATSSLMKGETLEDTAKVISQFVDIVAIRHPESGSATRFAQTSSVPVINAGDGAGQHPTQALLDLFTIKKELGKIDGISIAFSGDLKYGRCPNSLVYLLANYDVKFRFIAPPQLPMKDEVKKFLDEKGIEYEEVEDFKESLKDIDVLYATRIQGERFADPAEFEKLKDIYILTKKLVEDSNPDLTILHPLPRVHEISHEVDELKGAAYFRQVENGVAVRMALLKLLLTK